MTRPIALQRLFVGLYPPLEWSRQLLRAMESAGPAREAPETLRPTLPEQVHLTVLFIGDTPTARLGATIESIRRSASGIGAIELRAARLRTSPDRGPARLIALETDLPPNLAELHRRLVHRLARRTRAEAGDRFWPHFTLARFAAGRGPTEPWSRDLDPAEALGFASAEVRLMRSVLRPAGAEHVVVERIGLE